MKPRSKRLLILVVLSAAWIAAYQSGIFTPKPDASSWVRMVQEQGRLQSFSATALTHISCQGKDVSGNVRTTHLQPDKCRLEYTSGPLKGVIIGNDGKSTWRYDPKTDRLVVNDNRNCGGAGGKLDLLLKNHKARLAGPDRIAGRDASKIEILPNGSRKIRKRLWVDNVTKVILAQEDYDADGKLQSSTRFTSIRYADNFPEKLFDAPTGAMVTLDRRVLGEKMSLDKLSKIVGFKVRIPGYVPKGFRLDVYRLHACPCDCPHQSAYIRYTDGLDSISVFESKTGKGCKTDAGCGKSAGPTGTCDIKRGDRGEVVSLERDGISFVLVGDIGTRDLGKMAESLR